MNNKLTERQAFLVSAFTGVLCMKMDRFQEMIEEEMGHPVFTHTLGSSAFADSLKEKVKDEFLGICYDGTN